ncbi:hypothetical protein TNCV_3977051 [Trichonephila clavipes]|nr:hypothetical protein TNCV_3977051 [Trichonephila clavipes]
MLWGRQVAGRNYPPTNTNTLIRALTEEWDKLPQQLLDNVVQSMPDGRGYELVSSVRALVPQKFSVEEELMHVKHVDVKSPHVGVMWKFGRGYQLRYRPRHLTAVQNYVVARQ